jgi:ADP-ribose pyrophosphatase YjhB (NUDIX family)
MENLETTEQGARRELLEEAGARMSHLTLFAIFDLPFVSQIYLFFHGPLASATWEAGPESHEVELFKFTEIPWEELAFPVITRVLELYLEDMKLGAFGFHTGVIHERI